MAEQTPSNINIDIVKSAADSQELGYALDGYDHNGKLVTAYDTTGNGYTQAEFKTALKKYAESKGRAVEGFTFLKPGAIKNLRDTFEEGISIGGLQIPGNQAVQDFLKSAGRGTGQIVAAPKAAGAFVAEKLGLAPKESAQDVLQQGSDIGQSVGQFVGSQVSTPEKLAGTAVTAALPLITKGASLPLQLLKAAGAGGAANTIAQNLFGTAEQKNIGRQAIDAGKEAFTVGVTQGAAGVVKHLLGTSVTQQAEQQTATKVADLIKTKYRTLVNDPDALNIISSTPEGLRDLAQIRLTTLRGSSDEIAQQFSDDIVRMLGEKQVGAIGKRRINSVVNRFVAASDDLLNSVGDDAAMRVARGKMMNAASELTENITRKGIDLGKRSTLGTTRLDEASELSFGRVRGADSVPIMLFEYMKKMQGIVDNAHVLSSLRVATEGGRFNLRAYQKSIIDNFRAEPGSLMDEVGKVVLRGTQLKGLDRSTGINMNLGRAIGGDHPILSKIGIKIPTGSRYVGDIPRQAPVATSVGNLATRATLESIENYLSKKEE